MDRRRPVAGAGHGAPSAARIGADRRRRGRRVHAGRMPARPFGLVGQQYPLPTRAARGDAHPVWTYAHVPSGFTGDATEAILGADRAVRPRCAVATGSWPAQLRGPG